MTVIRDAIIAMKSEDTDIMKFSPAKNTELFIIKTNSQHYKERLEKGLIINKIEIDSTEYAIAIN